jgi:acyl-CoA thioester hydrolase
MSRPPPPSRAAYGFYASMATRWQDMDIYGHVNNVVFYSYFDTAIAALLMEEGGLDPWRDPVIGYCVDSGCRYHAPLVVPDRVAVGIRIARIGGSSVRYELGVFRNDDASACADGHFVHVFVDRASERPVPIPDRVRRALARYLTAAPMD